MPLNSISLGGNHSGERPPDDEFPLLLGVRIGLQTYWLPSRSLQGAAGIQLGLARLLRQFGYRVWSRPLLPEVATLGKVT